MGTEFALNPITGKLDLVKDITETITLNDLSDVTISNPQDDDFLMYAGGLWENTSLFDQSNTWLADQTFQDDTIFNGVVQLNARMEIAEDESLDFGGIEVRYDGTFHIEGNAEIAFSSPLSMFCYTNYFTVGAGTTNDVVMTWNVNGTDGYMRFMRDETRWEIDQPWLIREDDELFLRDTNLKIYSSVLGTLNIDSSSKMELSAPSWIKLITDQVDFGEGGDNDIVLNFIANTNSGIITWKEDEDYFLFGNDITMETSSKIAFGSQATYIVGEDTLMRDLGLYASQDIRLYPSQLVVIGSGAATDYTVQFNASVNSGEFKWMQDEDYFEFTDDILLSTTETIYWRDTDIKAWSNADGELTIEADTLLTLGVAGDITIGDSTERDFYPETDEKVNLGKDANRFNDLYLSGDAYIEGDLTVSGSIAGVSTRKKLLASDFVALHNYSNVRPTALTGEKFYIAYSPYDAIAWVEIPTGFKATAVMVYGEDTASTVTVYECEIDDGTSSTSKGSGVVGTEVDITDVTSTTTNYLAIAVNQGHSTNDELYGGYVDFEAV